MLDTITGVPQGSVLGSLLFILYINDIPYCLKTLKTMFADDASVYTSMKNIKDLIPAINNDLGIKIKANKLSRNIEKINYAVFTKIKYPHIKLFLNNTEIEQKTRTKFLGIIVDESLNWKAHILSNAKQNWPVHYMH